MPVSVIRTPRPRTSGGLLPLPQEWERWRNKLSRVAPPDHPALSSLNLPCDWHTVDQLMDGFNQIMAELQAPPVQDWATAQKQIEWRSVLERYHKAWCNVKEAKKVVRGIDHKRGLYLMGILPDDWNSREFRQVSLSVSDVTIFRSFEEAKRTIDKFMAEEVVPIETFLHSLDEALEFMNDPNQDYRMILKVLDRLESLENEVRELRMTKPKQKAA